MPKLLLAPFVGAILLLQTALITAQNLYDPAIIQEIKITFDFSDWDARMDAAISSTEDYIIAKTMEVNGQVFDSCGVKYKGNSSYSANNVKNPLHIELNTVKNKQDYSGITDLKLSNGFNDPTFVREVLSYWVLSHYMHCPRANFAKVYVNGTFYGLMTNVESVTKSFLSDHFASSGGAFFKCTPVGGAGPGGTNNYPTLKWLGADSSLYQQAYEIKSDAGWADLINLTDTLNNKTAAVDQILDVDRALWMLAFDNLLVNLDSYIGTFSQNYYLYRGDNRRFSSVVWDLNMSFGGFKNLAGATGPGGGGLDTTSMKNLLPLAVSTVTDRPLINKLLQNATYKRMYLAHMRTMLNEMFVSGEYLDKALEQQAIIGATVQTDVNKFYTYAQFLSNVYWSIASSGGPGGGMGGGIPGIVSLMNGRKNYLLSTAELSAVPPAISEVTSPSAPLLGTEVWITAKLTGTPISTLLGWRGETSDVFTRVTMFDDGQHHDGAAGDGVFGASFTVKTPKSEYYIYSENSSAGAFLPARAEHEFFSFETSFTTPNQGEVVINEFLAENVGGAADPAGEVEDWIELYNNTGTDIDLTGLYLSDNSANPTKWAFPNETSIPAHGYLIVWADEDGSQGGLHCNFKLKAGGEFVSLAANDGAILDSLSFGTQEADRSFGRYINGTGAFTFMSPTFSGENKLTTAVSDLNANGGTLHVFPNPASDLVQVAVSENLNDANVRLLDARGVLRYTRRFESFSGTEISVADLPSGVYFLSVYSNGKPVALETVAVMRHE